jgi:hypothetical protein
MRNKLIKIAVIAFLTVLAGSSHARPAMKADEPMESVSAAKKKKAGEECKTSDECRRHHRCEKTGEKSVCVAPEPREIPKT